MAVSSTSTADHAAHDALLLAALASGDTLAPADRARADVLVHDCPDCALLLADLAAIRAATADLPGPPRRRDFRLTDADAARLQPSGWRRILAGFGSPRARLTGPAAAGLATLGIAGLLFAAIPSAPTAGTASMNATAPAADTYAGSQAASAPPMEMALPAPSEAPAGAGGGERATAPSASPGADAKTAPEVPAAAGSPGESAPAILTAPVDGASPEPDLAGGAAADSGGAQAAPPAGDVAPPTGGSEGSGGAPWLVAGSLALLAAGLILGALRLAGTRVISR